MLITNMICKDLVIGWIFKTEYEFGLKDREEKNGWKICK